MFYQFKTKCSFLWIGGELLEFIINTVGLIIIDFMAIMYCSTLDKNPLLAFILLLIGNVFGGLLYKYKR